MKPEELIDMPWPTEIRLKKSENALHVTFDNGVQKVLGAFVLRANSPSAEVQGHGGKKPDVIISPNVRITGVEAVGNYAVRILFDDGHTTGLYSWTLLQKL